METERLWLRRWEDADAKKLFELAKDPDVGPRCGWPPHTSEEGSLDVIRNVLNEAECYAICEKGNNDPIGSVELILHGNTSLSQSETECELGYWIGKPYWGKGYMPEIAHRMLKRGFEELGMTTIWCGYWVENVQSKRVQEKLGFEYYRTLENVPFVMIGERRTEIINKMTKERWNEVNR